MVMKKGSSASLIFSAIAALFILAIIVVSATLTESNTNGANDILDSIKLRNNLILIRNNLGTNNPAYDKNNDGIVNILDMIIERNEFRDNSKSISEFGIIVEPSNNDYVNKIVKISWLGLTEGGMDLEYGDSDCNNRETIYPDIPVDGDYDWDTSSVLDGEHCIAITKEGNVLDRITIVIDNTKPEATEIETNPKWPNCGYKGIENPVDVLFKLNDMTGIKGAKVQWRYSSDPIKEDYATPVEPDNSIWKSNLWVPEKDVSNGVEVFYRILAEDTLENSGYTDYQILFAYDCMPPTTGISVLSPRYIKGTDMYITSSTDIVLECSDDDGSGCNEIHYSIDNREEEIVDGAKATLNIEGEDGKHSIEYYSVDNAGNIEKLEEGELNKGSFMLDNTAPEVSDDYGFDDIWTNQIKSPSIYFSDFGSGVKSLEYCDGTCVTVDAIDPVTITLDAYKDSITTFRYTAEDNLGQKSKGKFIAKIDTITPVTTDNAPSEWQSADFEVKLTLSDDGLSPVKTYYKINDGELTEGNIVSINKDGIWDIVYYSEDEAGNKEDEKTIQVKLDKNAPLAFIKNAPLAWQKQEARISASCDDETGGSGCASKNKLLISYTKLEECPKDYILYTFTSPQIITEHLWACSAAVDKAGNIGFSQVYEILVDKEMPEVEITSPSDNSILIGDTEIFASVSDELSGVASVRYQIIKENKVYKEGVLAYEPITKKYIGMIKDAMRDIPVGNYELIVTAKDNVENENSDKIEITASEYILPKITSLVSSAEYGKNSTLEYSIFFLIRNGMKIRMKMSDLTSEMTSYTPEQMNARLLYNEKEYPVRKNYTGDWIELEPTTAGAEGTAIFKLDVKDYMIPGDYKADYQFEVQ